ncbi:hypothetical protein [Paenibacillus glycanilyticus]|uniref:Uncharacterized protein n=1 Tax=Paenibacillus glycanilyticus TaxID=126569 RepID=A0ABQ6GP36_9BACL|nr:hypothetical protein [Paenibacillus glycanilyticus]GLX71357.1 hypothetical protein MU1_57070 [Paenibacillus glycanilyticus]
MKNHMMQGWRLAIKHFYIVILLFLYQLLWGFFLYRFIDSVVSPLLRRFPDHSPSKAAVQLFMSEAQFQIMKTDVLTPYLWLLGGLFLARMLLSPLFNAGLLYSLQHATESGGTQFLQGIRKAWKPVTLLYWTESLLVLAPAWWLAPRGLDALLHSRSINDLLQKTLPAAGGWILWGILLHLLFLAMQLGATSQKRGGIKQTLGTAVKHLLPFASLSLLMWAIGSGIGLFVSGLSLVWAGFIALLVHQGYHLVRTLLKVWTLASQYDILRSKEV